MLRSVFVYVLEGFLRGSADGPAVGFWFVRGRCFCAGVSVVCLLQRIHILFAAAFSRGIAPDISGACLIIISITFSDAFFGQPYKVDHRSNSVL